MNSLALIVNFLEIKGSFEDGKCPDYLKHYLLSDGNWSKSFSGYSGGNKYQQNFWPFVKFFEGTESSYYCDGDWQSRHRKEFKGIFRYYDYSEFFIYSILVILGFYISWESMRKK